MNNGKYGLGIVGFGGMADHHQRSLKSNEKIEVVSVCDMKADRLEYGQSLGYKPYEQYTEMLQDPAVDLILIATPNHIHKEYAIQALEAGKHVICEKPVTITSAEMKEIMDAVERTGSKFMVHQNRRWDDDYLTIKKIYDEKIIGDVFNIESRVHGSRGIPGDWRHSIEYGGGMMLDWGVHLIDRVMMMVNEKITKVYCQLSYVWKEECDDGFTLLLTFESGKTALLEVGTLNYQTLPLWYVCGTEGTATIKDWSMEGEMVRIVTEEHKDAKPIVAGAGFTKTMAPRGEEDLEKAPLPIVNGDVTEFYTNFVDVIEGKVEPFVKNEEVLKVMEIIEAAFESSKKGQAVLL